MGTRSITRVYEDNRKKQPIVSIYIQFDGYPEGVGLTLRDFINSKTLVNGHNGGIKQANGMGCLAAQIIEHLKDGVGNVYIEPVRGDGRDQEYLYEIFPDNEKENGINITCYDCYEKKYILQEKFD